MLILDPAKLDRARLAPEQPVARAFNDRVAGLLLDRDRVLLELVFVHNCSLRKVAAATGLHPGTVCRYVRRILQRMAQPIATLLADPGCPLTDEDRNLAIGFHLHGTPVLPLARQYGLTSVHVRERLAFVRGWLKGATSRRN